MKKNYQRELFEVLLTKPIAFNPGLVNILGSIDAALFISQLLYWHRKGKDKEWIYKTVAEFKEETSLSKYRQSRVIKRMKRIGILETKLHGLPRKRYFKLNFEKLEKIIDKKV